MSDLEVLRERIPGYAGYGNEAARHQVDKPWAALDTAARLLDERLGALAEAPSR